MSKELKSSSPLVSVVIAAYNSSGRLRCAVKSVLNQSHQNLEVIVIGDNCTDDSEVALQGINDSRIRWENLPTNWGEQSVPSNRGVDISRGAFIFFLNQDDLWLKSHIEDSLKEIEQRNLDVVWSEYLILPPRYRPRAKGSRPILVGEFSREIGIDPYIFIPASCTGWRQEALKSIGGWRTAGEVVVSPSQDLLWRAKRAGLTCGKMKTPSVLVLWSGGRPGSYLPSYKPDDNEFWLDLLTSTPDSISNEIEIAEKIANRKTVRVIYLLLGPVVNSLSFHPRSFELWLRYKLRGGFINSIRSRNSLDKKSFSMPNVSDQKR